MNEYARQVLELRRKQAPWETEFLQSVEELFESIGTVIESDPRIKQYRILERLTIPERIVTFQVPWVDRNGEIQVNTGWRVQFNGALGPYKGGLRCHPSVTLSTLKFLGFALGVKIASAFAAAHGQSGQSIFEGLFKTEELQR